MQAIDVLDEAGSRARIAAYLGRCAADSSGRPGGAGPWAELQDVLAAKAEAAQVNCKLNNSVVLGSVHYQVSHRHRSLLPSLSCISSQVSEASPLERHSSPQHQRVGLDCYRRDASRRQHPTRALA